MPDFINYKDYPKVGYPVNPISGIKFLNDEMDLDFVLPGYLSLRWQRSYFSDNSYVGWLGQGWNLPFSCHLLRNKKQITFINEQGSAIDFPRINESERYYHRQENLILEREENGRHSIILPSGDERYLFAPLTVNADDPTGNRAEFLPLIAIQDANGNVIRVVYQSLGLPKLLQDSVGRLLLFNFNSVNCQDNQLSPRLTQVRLVNAKGSPSELLVGYEYDNKGDLVAVVNAEGQVTRRFSYINHILTEHAQPGGRIVSYQYDKYTPNGKVLRQTTNLGQRWLFDYSENTTKVTDPLNRITNYQFDINRTFTGFIDALNQRSEVELDTLGRMTRLRVANNRIIDKHYNRYGRLTSSVDPSGLRCCYNYDYQQRLTCSTDVLQQTTRYEYSDQGDQFSIINPLGYRTDYFINRQGLVEKNSRYDLAVAVLSVEP